MFFSFFKIKFRRFIRGLFDAAGISEYNAHFYRELDAWETWKIEENEGKRKQIKKMCLDWILRWVNMKLFFKIIFHKKVNI